MATIADLRLQLDDATTLRLISSAFTEAAAARIGKIKAQFETNRAFYDEISHVYHLVRVASTTKEIKESLPPVSASTAAVRPVGGLPANPKRMSVAITSNQRFYGNLNVNIMRSFVEEIGKNPTDVFVVGMTGNDFMRSSGFPKPYEKLVFAKDNPTVEETAQFLDKTTGYDEVMVYYPKFVSLVTQTTGIIDITQAVNPKDPTPEEEIHILFEPEYLKILEFFQRQVRSLLFLHVMLESDLSRTAARLLAMSSAEERSSEMIKETRGQLRKLQLSIMNAKLLETFAGIKKWKK